MKYFLIVPCLFVAAAALSQEFQEKAMDKMAEIAEKCVPAVGANDEDIGELMERKMPSRREGKCLIACFSKELGMMKDGKPSKEGTIAALEPLKADDADLYDKAMKILETCEAELQKETETDECELAVKAAACTHKTGKEMGIDAESIMG
ncbi:hypothetical protein ILUMI_01243 [Ignelater luminosus]|uniref:Uncharacterized protein n=1 Tax=Ignelater luminosus TaxID=2038154 RepID=A0A8K0GKF9_IGNLU|nr:hypothetical protein ILUMI_01243 [Ignelater luminosus]